MMREANSNPNRGALFLYKGKGRSSKQQLGNVRYCETEKDVYTTPV